MPLIPPHRWSRLIVAAPALAALALVLVAGVPSATSGALLWVLITGLTMVAVVALRDEPMRWTRTMGNLLDALREGDYGIRATVPEGGGEYAELITRLNQLATQLHDERRGLAESLQLLSKTLASLDGAVFAFEENARLRLVNPAGERLLGREGEDLLGRPLTELGLQDLFDLPSGSLVARTFPGQRGRWQISHAYLRSRSQIGRLLVVLPMERALRQEEADAFRRLLRVLSHEISNSIAPIASVADTLRQRTQDAPSLDSDPDLRELLGHGLGLIEQRSLGLQRFIAAYTSLARLPPPTLAPLSIAEVCRHVHGLINAGNITLVVDADAIVAADRDQLEQVLINLLRNAIEAGGAGSAIELRCGVDGTNGQIDIIDEGPGPPREENQFVPFFTTKPGGSGIGLVLSRQIVEAQSGSLFLTPREQRTGTVATVLLPIDGTLTASAGPSSGHAAQI